MSTCNCPAGSAFHWHANQRPSLWLHDAEVVYSQKQQKTRSQIGSETKAQIEQKTGRQHGDVGRLSKRSRR